MAECVPYVSSMRVYTSEPKRLREFRDTINQRREIVAKRKERFNMQFYITRNLPVPEVPVIETLVEEESGAEEGLEDQSHCDMTSPLQWAYKNVYAASIAFMLVFSAFVGVQNLQSSLNSGLGTISLALVYVFFLMVGFFTPSLVRFLSTKYSLLFGFCCHVIYIATNFYPDYFTLIPSSVILGIGSGPIWAGISTHLASVAVIIAPFAEDTLEILISKFTGLFFFIFQLTQILGNLVSSLVLFPYSRDMVGTGNSTFLEEAAGNSTIIEICNNMEAQSVSAVQRYILFSIYLSFDFLGIVILLLLVDKLPQEMAPGRMQSKINVYCVRPFLDLLKLLFSRDMLLLGPLSLYNGMELSFAYSSYTQDIISDCVGVSKVGFALIVLGFFSAVVSVLYGKMVKHIHRLIIGSLAFLINLFFLLFVQFYPLRPNFALIFLFAIFWGIADGIWNTLTASLVGILFPKEQEAAFSAFRIWMSLGFAIGFVIMQVKTLSDRLWVMIAVLVFSFIMYFVLEILKLKHRKSS